MSDNTALATVENKNVAIATDWFEPAQVVAQVKYIHNIMRDVMKDGEHYGTIPGCGDKKVLKKPGAEILIFSFRMGPKYKVDIVNLENGHKEFHVFTSLWSADGKFIAEGVGMASTMESKFRYRNAKRVCPNCGKETINKSKYEDGGWYCYTKAGGCNAKFDAKDPKIIAQPLGKVENPDIADVCNTVLKMAKKRSMVDAVLTATAASDTFTQDLDDDLPTAPIESETSQQQPPPQQPQGEHLKKGQKSRPELLNDFNGLLRAQSNKDEVWSHICIKHNIKNISQLTDEHLGVWIKKLKAHLDKELDKKQQYANV